MREKLMNNRGETNRILLFFTLLICAVVLTFNIISIIINHNNTSNREFLTIRIYDNGTLIDEHIGFLDIKKKTGDEIVFIDNGVEFTYVNCCLEIIKD